MVWERDQWNSCYLHGERLKASAHLNKERRAAESPGHIERMKDDRVECARMNHETVYLWLPIVSQLSFPDQQLLARVYEHSWSRDEHLTIIGLLHCEVIFMSLVTG